MAAPARARYRNALRARDLRLLLAAFAADSLGSWAYNVVLVVHLYDRTGSTAVIAATTACGWLPRLAVSAYAGVVADRYERRRVMLLSSGTCLLLVLALSAAVASAVPILVLLLLHGSISTVSAFYEPAAQALLPEVVDEQGLVPANALFNVVDNLAVIAGPALGALFLLTGRPATGILFNAVTFLASLVAIRALRIRSTGSASEEGGGALSQMITGVRAVRQEPTAVVLLVFATLSTAVYGALSLLLVPLSERFGTGSEGYAYLLAALAVGGIVGAALVNRLAARPRLAPVIVAGMCLLAAPLAASALVRSPVLGAALLVVAGAGMVVVDVLAVTGLQRDLPNAVLSRVLGLLQGLGLAGALLASVCASALLRLLTLDATLVLLGLVFGAASVLLSGPLRRADRRNAEELAGLAPRIAALDGLDLLEGASPEVLQQLARSLVREERPAGTEVVREGEVAEAMYLVESGSLSVRTAGAPALPDVEGGGFFGEIGLLLGRPRTATVATRTPSVLWRLAADDFTAALQDSRPSQMLTGLVDARLARSRAVARR